MKNTSSFFFSCGLHKMCNSCISHFGDTTDCPFCKKLRLRNYEKVIGKSYINPDHLFCRRCAKDDSCLSDSLFLSTSNCCFQQNTFQEEKSSRYDDSSFWSSCIQQPSTFCHDDLMKDLKSSSTIDLHPCYSF